MKLQPYIKRLVASKEYKGFVKKHSDAFAAAGFFVIDFETGSNIHQIDYYIPSEKKIAAFTLDKGVAVQEMTLVNSKVPEKLDVENNIDLDELRGIVQDEMKNRSMTEDIKKMIAVLQTAEGKKIWNVNCVLSGMEILRAHVDDATKTVLKMDKISMMDIMKKMPQMQIAPKGGASIGPKSSEDVKQQIKKLNILEQAIEKEKENLEKKSKGAKGKKDSSPKKAEAKEAEDAEESEDETAEAPAEIEIPEEE
jgi:hypothetical protein